MADAGSVARGPAVYTIPPHRGFADALVAGLLRRHQGDPLALARGLILVPNARAARAISDAFVRRAAKGLLLPRLVPIGDLDEDAGAALDPIGEEDLPPAVEPMARRMILARLVAEERTRAGDPIDAAEAIRLAGELARTLDQLLVEEIAPAALADLAVAPELSLHWQKSLAVLRVVLERWPAELRALGRIDRIERQNRLLRGIGRRWRATPPGGFVVAAGITQSGGAVAGLLRTISRLPAGMVVLPGVDCAMAEDEWRALGPHEPDPETGRRPRSIETHPQFQLKLLLDRIGIGRGEVREWSRGGGVRAPAVRSRAIANAMAPAAFTGKWQSLPPRERRLSGVRAVELATPAEQAQAIALALRHAIETPVRTAALVTPDRALARRVSAHLRRWNIDADDSAGRPLSALPPGTLLLALAQAATERFAPVALLALLKHPLVRFGEERVAWLAGVRALDRALRRPRPPAGLEGVTQYLAAGDEREREIRERTQEWWRSVLSLLSPLEAAFNRPPSRAKSRDVRQSARASDVERVSTSLDTAEGEVSHFLSALREGATALAGDAVWSGPAGREASALFEALEASAALGPADARPEAIGPLLRTLLDEVAVRPPQGGHPRIFIWGLIEARLQQADLMILGGLNEGVWPAAPAPDPWLSPRIRSTLGLPGLERRIGIEAHEFASGLGAPRVLVTRARRDDRAPAIASRLWLRLEAMTGGLTRDPALRRLARLIDQPADFAPADRPMPTPPIEARPQRIAVTQLDRLRADPFAFYANAILRLAPWDAVDADPGPAWRGIAVHAILEAWMKQDGCDPDLLERRARALLDQTATHPVVRALWTPRLMEAIEWIAEKMRDNFAEGRRPLVAEVLGETRIGEVEVYGKVDRIDRLSDGTLAIVDYKTGKPPGTKQVAAGFSLQLGLLGAIAQAGGFAGAEGTPAAFEYWSLASDKGKLGYVKSPVGGKGADAIAPEDFTRHAARALAAAAARWLTGHEPFTAKLHPELAPYADYNQLMRLDEWYGR